MDESREEWLSDLEMDDCNLIGDMNSLVEVFEGENSVQQELWWKGHYSDANLIKESTTLRSDILKSLMPNPLAFEDYTAVPHIPKKTCQYHGEYSKETLEEPENNRKSKRGRSSSIVQDHITTERKRRENITRMFIALSAIIPGLKKMDRVSILKYAFDYVKYLQKRVKDLEEQNKKRKIESAVCFKMNKSNVSTVADDFSCKPDGLDTPIKICCPKVEARVLAKVVLIRVMCEKQKNIVPKLLAKLEALNLSIVCINVLPFGNSMLNITSIAQMGHGQFSMRMDVLMKVLTEDLFECCNMQQ
ncbi:transcription factor bHLH18-like [Abrus precatorius]|uniref:Transcription factor bHLH18-like n=1 Tax=Abrus precatorius TaxID=3816 RepID=A0A8B8K083_ABRPR|nr:transcription factor bHLH18-like [Abrus precatorius]